MLGRGFLTARATVSSITDLAPASRSARAPKHPVSPQLPIHHLPVKRVHCQLDCPDVWQKRHALTPIVPPDSALAYPAAPACASAAPLCAAIGAFLPGAWRVATFGCTPLPFALAMQRYWNHHVRRQPITSAFTNSASRSANHPPQRLDLLEFQQQDRPHHRVLIHCKASRPVEGISSVPASRAEQRLPLFLRPSRQRPPANLACDVGHAFKTTRGTPGKWVPGSRSSAAARRFSNPRGKAR